MSLCARGKQAIERASQQQTSSPADHERVLAATASILISDTQHDGHINASVRVVHFRQHLTVCNRRSGGVTSSGRLTRQRSCCCRRARKRAVRRASATAAMLGLALGTSAQQSIIKHASVSVQPHSRASACGCCLNTCTQTHALSLISTSAERNGRSRRPV
jgi:hypothetical protein